MILEVTLDLPGRDVEGDHRGRVEIVARSLVPEPGRSVARAPEGEIGLGIVGAGDPDGAAAALVMVAARRPGLAAGLARLWHGVGLPELLAGPGIDRGHEAAHTQFAARCAEDHLAVDDQRRHRHVVGLLVVVNLRGPGFLSGLDVERDQHAIGGREIDLVAVERDAAAGRMQMNHVFRKRPLVTPQQLAGRGLDGEHLVTGRGHEHDAVVHDGRGLMALHLAGRHAPDLLQAPDGVRRDLLERAEAPTIVGAAEVEPVTVFRILQPFSGDRCVFLQHLRHRPRHRRGGSRCDRLLRGSRGEAGGDGESSRADALQQSLAMDHDTSPFP